MLAWLFLLWHWRRENRRLQQHGCYRKNDFNYPQYRICHYVSGRERVWRQRWQYLKLAGLLAWLPVCWLIMYHHMPEKMAPIFQPWQWSAVLPEWEAACREQSAEKAALPFKN